MNYCPVSRALKARELPGQGFAAEEGILLVAGVDPPSAGRRQGAAQPLPPLCGAHFHFRHYAKPRPFRTRVRHRDTTDPGSNGLAQTKRMTATLALVVVHRFASTPPTLIALFTRRTPSSSGQERKPRGHAARFS